jgi:transposase
MSYEELDRASVIERVIERRLTQREAARMLGLTSRQVRRLCRAYERNGPGGLASKQRGRPSNRRLASELRREALATVRSRYEGFGPTLAHEKLTELHGLELSVETLRHWMIEDGLWIPRARREPRIQQPRRRRPCRGELVQIDGCDHEWFEERAGRCTLLVFVDDATGALMELRFCESESAFSYFAAMRSYLEQHGKPVALYSDKATVFRVNKKEPQGGAGITQFGRALSSLNIDILCANTPAAKGRVERAHLTLQDRLVKELRLRGIRDLEAANAFAPEFIADYNRRFARAPRSEHNAHRPLQPSDDLARIFSWQETRLVSKSLTLSYKRVLYVLDPTDAAGSAREEGRHRGAGGRLTELLARRARAAGDGLPEGARRAGRSRREQAARGDDGTHQGTSARAHRSESREAVDDPAQGPPAARRNAAADHSGALRRDAALTDGRGKADISTLEKTGHLYFGPTRGDLGSQDRRRPRHRCTAPSGSDGR